MYDRQHIHIKVPKKVREYVLYPNLSHTCARDADSCANLAIRTVLQHFSGVVQSSKVYQQNTAAFEGGRAVIVIRVLSNILMIDIII